MPRHLTDEDVEAIVALLTTKVKQEFYEDLGRGVWSIAWKVIIGAIVGIAALGAHKGWW